MDVGRRNRVGEEVKAMTQVIPKSRSRKVNGYVMASEPGEVGGGPARKPCQLSAGGSLKKGANAVDTQTGEQGSR